MLKFFNYFGGKHRLAKHYSPPRHDVVIEPFAGSAGYSLFYNVANAKLYDLNEDVCLVWDYLINCSDEDIKRLPDWVRDNADIYTYDRPETYLMGRWLKYSNDQNLPKKSELSDYQDFVSYHRDGKISKSPRNLSRGKYWSPYIKKRIIDQKPLIKNWSIDHCSYEKIPDYHAHWFIDPPYNSNKILNRYKNSKSDIDFTHLSQWCRDRKGYAEVCEIEGADWLPFNKLRSWSNQKGKAYTEVVWSSKQKGIF